MRFFLPVLIFIFSLQSWTKADDIRDFEIEGMSIGDSLLDYFSENEIIEKSVSDYKDKTFTRTDLKLNNSKIYEHFQFHFKTNDKKYKIHMFSAGNFLNDKDDYKNQMSEIDKN